jgi:predicted Fe-Mo cluster-binding NifX family protein
MKIAFPTNDRKTIAKRTGRCKEFVIYDLADSKIIDISYLENNHEHHDHDHGSGDGHHDHKKGEEEHSHAEIGEILKDVDVLVVGRVGKFMKKALEGFNIKYQLTKKLEIQEVVDEFLEGID